MTGARKTRFLHFGGAPRPRRRSNESGYAYLLALFMVLALIITSQTLLENLATQGRRMREQETIWRGEQCERAIRLYYHKTGHYPQTFDDLNAGLPELHFLRAEAEKNPMNKTDGSWRFIYINAAGQIIGSVKYATLQQMAIMDLNHGKIPKVMPGAVSASSLASQSQTGQSSPNSQQSGMNFGAGQTENPLAALKPTGPVDGPVVGGFLTGVAGKTDAKSLIVYKGGKKYLDWEFIWNPIEDQARAMQQQSGSATGGGLLPGFTNLPGLPAGLTGAGTSPTGTAATPGEPGTSPSTSPQAPSSPTGAQPSPSPPDQNSD
ncbi:MAG TPA: hypothetical protein VNK23_05960 [Candidatus Dormibacteraeota bacterium]|nr:hypothetical protein [Candidatus Dormibacteraeota bacterium]